MNNRTYSAPAARKAMLLLEMMTTVDKPFTIAELSSALNISNNSVFRILKELQSLQYIEQHSDGGYILTPKLYYLGSSIGDRISLKQSAQQFMEKLSFLTKETVILTTFGSHYSTLIVDQKISTERMKFISTVGMEYSSYSSAMGKAMLAYISSEKLNHYLEYVKFIKETDYTITTKDELLNELQLIRDQGYATDKEESVIGVNCIAAPVFSVGGYLEGAIGISGPKFRLRTEELGNIADLVKEQALLLSSALGYSPEGN